MASKNTKDVLVKKYICTVCGYIYNPANGDSHAGIKPGTEFSDLPATWVCPICGATKDEFEPYGD